MSQSPGSPSQSLSYSPGSPPQSKKSVHHRVQEVHRRVQEVRHWVQEIRHWVQEVCQCVCLIPQPHRPACSAAPGPGRWAAASLHHHPACCPHPDLQQQTEKAKCWKMQDCEGCPQSTIACTAYMLFFSWKCWEYSLNPPPPHPHSNRVNTTRAKGKNETNWAPVNTRLPLPNWMLKRTELLPSAKQYTPAHTHRHRVAPRS